MGTLAHRAMQARRRDVRVKIVALTGFPGAGKTTLAGPLAERLGARVVSPGDAARQHDPHALAEGRMADEGLIRDYMTGQWREGVDDLVLDGFPRTQEQADLLPDGSLVVWLSVGLSVAAERLRGRGRADDTDQIIQRRLEEQSRLMRNMASRAHIITNAEQEAEYVLESVTEDIEYMFSRRDRR